MITIIICVAIYLLSVYGMYKFIQLAHYHPRGIFKCDYPGGDDIFFTLFPGVNTIALMVSWIFFFPIRKDKVRRVKRNFFEP